jgi:hypothetical protein
MKTERTPQSALNAKKTFKGFKGKYNERKWLLLSRFHDGLNSTQRSHEHGSKQQTDARKKKAAEEGKKQEVFSQIEEKDQEKK